MPAYVIAHIDVKDPVKYEDYKKMSPVSIEKFGGRFIARGGKAESLEGSWQPKRLVLIEFPSVEVARQWWPPRTTRRRNPSARRRQSVT